MTVNPWQVDSVQEFSFLKCPECKFETKEEYIFQNHAVLNHPLSIVLFGNGFDVNPVPFENKESKSIKEEKYDTKVEVVK